MIAAPGGSSSVATPAYPAALAPGFRNPFALLARFRRPGPGPEHVTALRRDTSRWIERYRLPASDAVTVEDRRDGRGGGWQVFRPRDVTGTAEVFYLHGGGLVFYSLEDYGSLLAHWAATGACAVTGFDYPKAPEHGFEDILARVETAVAARLAELAPSAPVVLAGDSVGAYMALWLARRRRPRRFTRLVLLYPVLDVDGQRPSYGVHGTGYPLTAEMMTWFQRLCRARGGAAVFDPFGLGPRDWEAMPEVRVFSAELDVLRDEAFDWVAYATARGHAVVHRHFADLPHDFCLYAGAVPEARAAAHVVGRHLCARPSEETR